MALTKVTGDFIKDGVNNPGTLAYESRYNYNSHIAEGR